MRFTLSPFLLILCSVLVPLASTEPQVLIDPKSRLIPLGAEAIFTCKFSDVDDPYWFVKGMDASAPSNSDFLMTKGIFVDQKHENGPNVTLTLRVNSSYDAVNNTKLLCKTYSNVNGSNVETEVATVNTIAESPLVSNPSVEQPNVSTLLVKWSPPFLWPGHAIESYNIFVTNNTDGSVTVHSTTPSDINSSVESFPLVVSGPSYGQCTNFTFEITPSNTPELVNQTRHVNGTLMSPLGNFEVDPIVLFTSNGTPVVRVNFQPSPQTCPDQELRFVVTVMDKRMGTLAFADGPIVHQGREVVDHEMRSQNFKRRREFVVNFTVFSEFETSTVSWEFNTYLDSDPTQAPCTYGTSTKADAANTYKYKVAMSACLALVLLMLFTLLSLIVCLVIHRRRKISQQKNFDESTNRIQNAMVHNPIYDGPVYESVQPHFDSLTSVTKQDLSSSNTSACNSPPPSCSTSTPPNTLGNSSQANVRYLDRPIHGIQPHAQRSLSLSNPSTPDNDVNQLTMSTQVPTQRSMALKKNGKERNKLHLTLTLVGANDEANTKQPVVSKDSMLGQSRDRSMTVPGVQVGGGQRSSGDDNYSVMKPLAGSGMNTVITELSPEDTEKYRE